MRQKILCPCCGIPVRQHDGTIKIHKGPTTETYLEPRRYDDYYNMWLGGDYRYIYRWCDGVHFGAVCSET